MQCQKCKTYYPTKPPWATNFGRCTIVIRRYAKCEFCSNEGEYGQTTCSKCRNSSMVNHVEFCNGEIV